VTIKREGTITVWYRSADIYGNLETAKSCTVRIDTIPPTVRDGDAVVLRGAGPAAFTYRLADNLSTRLSCRLVVTQFGRPKIVVRTGERPTDRWLTLRTHVALAPGYYTWRIVATDQAGNRSSGRGRILLVIAPQARGAATTRLP